MKLGWELNPYNIFCRHIHYLYATQPLSRWKELNPHLRYQKTMSGQLDDTWVKVKNAMHLALEGLEPSKTKS